MNYRNWTFFSQYANLKKCNVHAVHSQHEKNKNLKKENIILFHLNCMVTIDGQQQGFWSLPLLSHALYRPNRFLPGTHFNPVASMSITLFPFIPSSKGPAKNTWASCVQATKPLSTTKWRRESKSSRDKPQCFSSHLFLLHIHARGRGGAYSYAHMQINKDTYLSFLSPWQRNQLKL